MVLLDWQKGKIPFFTLPPGHTEEKPPPSAAALETSDAAAVAASVPVEELDELPAPAEAVTEEDAVREAGARAEDAAAGK